MKQNTSESLITELAFKLILESEETEGYEFNVIIKDENGKEKFCNLNKNIILEFLNDEYTKLAIKFDGDEFGRGFGYVVASNSISNESIRISGLAHHYLALLSIVDSAQKKREELYTNPNAELLSHNFVKDTNLNLQRNKEGEIAIGDYRKVDYFGRPVEVSVSTNRDEHLCPINSIKLCKSVNVENEMDKLIKWTNSAFSDNLSSKEILENVAKFHAQFIKIHPFRDGNGRTARLLTNYLLLIFNQPIISIPLDRKNDYICALDFANSSDIRESAREITGFDKFLVDKFKQIYPNRKPKNIDEVIDGIEEYLQDNDKYEFVVQNFEENQLPLSSKNVITKILNDYAQKSLEEHIKIGKISSEQVDYEKID